MSQSQKKQIYNHKVVETAQVSTETLVVKDIEGLGEDLINEQRKHNGFLGVSLSKRFFSKEHIKMYFDWALSHCKEFVLLIDDWEEQHNYRVFKKLTNEQAKARALSEGNNKKRAFTRVLNRYSANQRAKVKIMCSSELFQNPEHAQIWSIRNKLVSAFSQNPEFRKAVMQQVHTNISKRIAAWRSETGMLEEDNQYRQALELLPMYLLEEIAVTIYLREQMGFPTEIYPASAMPVVRDLYEGKYLEPAQKYLSRDNYGYINLGIE